MKPTNLKHAYLMVTQSTEYETINERASHYTYGSKYEQTLQKAEKRIDFRYGDTKLS